MPVGMIVTITPVIGWSWPALAPVLLAAGAAVGFKLVFDSKDEGELTPELRNRLLSEDTVQLQLDQAVEHALFDEVRRGDAAIFRKDALVLMVTKDERGRLRITVTAPKGTSRELLRAEGQAFAREIAQLFATNRVVEQLARLNFDVVEEEQTEEGEIRLKVRRWNG